MGGSVAVEKRLFKADNLDGRSSPVVERIRSHALTSYVSEPPSSLIAIARMAQEEQERENSLLDDVGMQAPRHLVRSISAQKERRSQTCTRVNGVRDTLVWFQARDANRYQERVLEHPVAGDLAVASAAEAAAVGRRPLSPIPSPRMSPTKTVKGDGNDGSNEQGDCRQDEENSDGAEKASRNEAQQGNDTRINSSLHPYIHGVLTILLNSGSNGE